MVNTSATLLSAVTDDGASSAVQTHRYREFTFVIVATSVTTGATVAIQFKRRDGSWVDLEAVAVGANGNTVKRYSGFFREMRADVRSRTDGTYTVEMEAGA